jgi:hypothetical protein
LEAVYAVTVTEGSCVGVLFFAMPLLHVKGGTEATVRCAVLDRKSHSKMPSVPNPAGLKLLHACDQWHSSLVFTHLTGRSCKLMSLLLPAEIVNSVQTLKAAQFFWECVGTFAFMVLAALCLLIDGYRR